MRFSLQQFDNDDVSMGKLENSDNHKRRHYKPILNALISTPYKTN